ncbi:MAG: hypothetical protein KY441_08660 [Actinobacteria bacterium]|nr:hypothetical protein [Actinomycetota bacterium]
MLPTWGGFTTAPITPLECPAGTEGVALQVDTGDADTTIGGSVTITLVVDGTVVTETIPVDEGVAGPGQTVTVFACAGVEPGLTGVEPGLTGVA